MQFRAREHSYRNVAQIFAYSRETTNEIFLYSCFITDYVYEFIPQPYY